MDSLYFTTRMHAGWHDLSSYFKPGSGYVSWAKEAFSEERTSEDDKMVTGPFHVYGGQNGDRQADTQSNQSLTQSVSSVPVPTRPALEPKSPKNPKTNPPAPHRKIANVTSLHSGLSTSGNNISNSNNSTSMTAQKEYLMQANTNRSDTNRNDTGILENNLSSGSRSIDDLYIPNHKNMDSSTDHLDNSSNEIILGTNDRDRETQSTNSGNLESTLMNNHHIFNLKEKSKDLESGSANSSAIGVPAAQSSSVTTKGKDKESSTTNSAVGNTLRRAAKVFGKRLKAQRTRSSQQPTVSGDANSSNPNYLAQNSIPEQLSLDTRLFNMTLENLYPPIPNLILNCIEDIELRGISLKGIYRVNGVKTRVDMLSDEFEKMEEEYPQHSQPSNLSRDACNSPTLPDRGDRHQNDRKSSSENILSSSTRGEREAPEKTPETNPEGSSSSILSSTKSIDLSLYSPHDVSSVLKRFLQQLPEPLFTFELYDDFMRISRKFDKDKDDMSALQEACDLIKLLPEAHKATLEVLLKHLHLVSLSAEENKMTPSNLGVVFGPTLFRNAPNSNKSAILNLNKDNSNNNKSNATGILSASSILDEIKDMPDQARLIELLIINRDFISCVCLNDHSNQVTAGLTRGEEKKREKYKNIKC